MKEHHFTIIGWGIVALFAAGILIGSYMQKGVSQPVPFNHKKHVDFGIACVSCHTGAEDSDKADIPNVRTCALCHVPGKENPRTVPELEDHIRKMETILWKRIYEAPGHVKFSHRRHVQMGGLDCSACHGAIGRMEKAVSRQPVALAMSNCRSCHSRERISTDCLTCHK